MDAVITRAIVTKSGIVATASRALELPFLPSIGMTLLYGTWTVVVNEIALDLETKRVLITDTDDRSLAQIENVTKTEVIKTLAAYASDGWLVTRMFASP